jgi:hypothetical protein
MHHNVISQTNKINEGNKRNLAESKTDLVRTLQKSSATLGGTRPQNISCRMTSRTYPGQHQYLTMGRWTQMMEQLRTAEYLCHRRSVCDVRMFGVCKVAITPPPKNVGRLIYEYVDRKKSSVFFVPTT